MNCSTLTTLNLRINNFGGNLSALNFSTLLNLRKLDLGNNMFTGSFPVSLFSCKSLTALRLAENNLTGQIPEEILTLQSLSYLSLSRNSLTNISDAIRILMGCRKLSAVILSKNFCNSSLPDDGSLEFPDGFQNLQVFALGNCQLKGQLPAWLGKLKNLQVLDLSFNQITGTIPSWLKNLPRLFYIDLSSNFISGEFPKELAQLSALTSTWDEEETSYLELPVFVWPNNRTTQQYNQLSILPPAIYLRNNSLSAEIPIQIGQLKLLHVLDLSDNSFTGNIPDEISNLTNLEALYLSGNRLSGEIPASVKSLHFLSSFSVANNNLQGSIPSGGQFDTFPNPVTMAIQACVVQLYSALVQINQELSIQKILKKPLITHFLRGSSRGLFSGLLLDLLVHYYSLSTG
ncbi:tyrosine-sulfated glycopeptide receptor 1 [Tripterygium wilfordii]|uniref:Tyrosine-sulfated glycopeptide receptor 1 n=1 Tax=Tripterygium wilfordii TaxID=458696 RepID=A0A7J7C9A2_TRIWF|nr:tyrosine-sulfated glycopeptide receptor 1 [Tripterygium wilfordii]